MSNEEHGTVATSDEPVEAKCPVMHPDHQSIGITANQVWWPEQLNLRILRQNHPGADPMGGDFDYASEFQSLDFDALARDVDAVMTDSKEWWPADYGHYGPFFIRMTWHAAGTYRTLDGRGGGGAGAQRFAPLNSWPDNANLDKARRLLWPIKQKYGRKISWADLLIFAGNRALETMGFKTFGFGGGRDDIWAPEEDVYWGPEQVWLGDERYTGDRQLANPLGAVQMGLIYVNPEGPNGNPDPLASARDVRETFARMAMNDEETVALVAGGHTFGKAHGAANPDGHVGREPEGAGLAEQGLGWTSSFASGMGDDTITSGIEGAWTADPIRWDNGYFDLLFRYDWELAKSPAGAWQWHPKDIAEDDMPPAAHNPSKKALPMMTTADMALKMDPIYHDISKRFHENPDQFADAFARAWYKLLHRDMGPAVRYLGPWVPDEELIWQDPVPAADHELVDAADIADLKAKILGSGLSVSQLVSTAWARLDLPRHRQAGWGQRRPHPSVAAGRVGCEPVVGRVRRGQGAGRHPGRIQRIGRGQEGVAGRPDRAGRLCRCRGCGQGRRPRRHRAIQSRTHRRHPGADRCRLVRGVGAGGRRLPQLPAEGQPLAAEHQLVDKAFLLNLTAPEMTALVGGMRVLDANVAGAKHGVLTDRPGVLTNDFFVNLLDMGTEWKATTDAEDVFEGRDRSTGEVKWTGTRVDLAFGSNSELRALAEVYGTDDAKDKFVGDFVAAWTKVMENDRFDLKK
jgi:catalase-peroxidase